MEHLTREKIDSLGHEIKDRVAGLLQRMIRIPSTSGKENVLIDFLQKEMHFFDNVRVDDFGNIQGRIGQGKRLIAMDAHIDTVGVGDPSLWEKDPFSGERSGGYIWGRGASDQEGGMAALITAGYLMKKYNLIPSEYTILITGTVSEEDCDGLCWRYLIEREKIKPECCVITEPTDCKIYRGHRGRMEITARMPGISAHGSAPERGQNAIYKMASIISKIEQLNNTLKVDPFLGKGSITISQIRSTAPSLCSVADSCEIYLDRRLTWGEKPEDAIKEIQELDVNKELEVEIPIYRTPTHTGYVLQSEKVFPAWKVSENDPVINAGAATYRSIFGKEPVIGKWTFSTNGVAVAGMHQIPCIGFGPGKEKWAHAPNERVEVNQLVEATLFYAFFAEHYNSFE